MTTVTITQLCLDWHMNEKIINGACKKYGIRPKDTNGQLYFSQAQVTELSKVIFEYYDNTLAKIRTRNGIMNLLCVDKATVSANIKQLGIEPIGKEGAKFLYSFEDVKKICLHLVKPINIPVDYIPVNDVINGLNISATTLYKYRDILGLQLAAVGRSAYLSQFDYSKLAERLGVNECKKINTQNMITTGKSEYTPIIQSKNLKRKCELLGITLREFFELKDKGELIPLMVKGGLVPSQGG